MFPDAIIFDLDGTLLDTLDDLAESMNESLAEAGFPIHPVPAYIVMIGSGLKSLISIALPPSERDEKTIGRVLRIMKRIYTARMTRKTRPYDGIPGLLDKLEKAGIPKAILSNKPDEMTQGIVPELLGKWNFNPIMGSTARFPKKPDPTAPLFIAGEMKVNPSDVAFVGDSSIDMETGLASGMKPIGVTWGFGKKEELDRFGVFRLVDSPAELYSVLAEFR
jgi:phosphoglycolate phosphatase